MNKVIISGNMVKDMEVVVTKSGYTIGKFTIANNRRVGEKDIVTFVNCNMFGEKRVEGLQKYLLKGAKVLVDGVLDISNVEDEEGWKTYTSVNVDNIDILKFVNEEAEEKKPNNNNRKYNNKRK